MSDDSNQSMKNGKSVQSSMHSLKDTWHEGR
jgi:hypothetical protein